MFNASAAEEGEATALCDADCTLVDCGDGVVSAAAGEDCDDAGESATCNADCSSSGCGDGITNGTAGESCDDTGESMSCDSDCSVVSCGDGLVNATAGEGCDEAGESATCDVDCTAVVCGDGSVNVAAGEARDGAELAGATCGSQGFASGTLACTPGCAYDVGGCLIVPGVPVLMLGFSAVKLFDFSGAAVDGADYYQLEESTAPGEPFVQLGADMVGLSVSHEMPLHFRWEASYRLRACNLAGCTESAVVDVVGSLAAAVGYVKASNTDSDDSFGASVALSADGSTLAVGASLEDSSANGIGGDPGRLARAAWPDGEQELGERLAGAEAPGEALLRRVDHPIDEVGDELAVAQLARRRGQLVEHRPPARGLVAEPTPGHGEDVRELPADLLLRRAPGQPEEASAMATAACIGTVVVACCGA